MQVPARAACVIFVSHRAPGEAEQTTVLASIAAA